MIKDIITDPNKLNTPCEDIAFNDPLRAEILTDLLDTADKLQDKCLGLAANQIGYPYRVFMLKVVDRFYPIINPKIVTKFGGQVTKDESCLSSPGEIKSKARYKRIRLEFYIGNRLHMRVFSGLEARIIQHEMDHLDGVLF